MKKYDLCVHGHITIDHIFDDFKETTSLGAIGNFWYALTKLDTKLNVKLNLIAIGEAIVLVDKEKSMRIGKGHLNMKTRTPPDVDASWHHIMYMNKLPDLSFIDKLTGTISADVTSGKMDQIIPYLSKIDFLFISDEDLFMDIFDLVEQVRGSVILHYPSGSYCYKKNTVYVGQTEPIKNINVLGAGDIFAAGFILKYIERDDILDSLDFAHKKTTEILLSRNENEA